MAMTEEERRQARNEASKRWYAAHKAAKKAAKPAAGAKQKPAKKVEAKPAQAARPAKRASGPDPVAAAEKLCRTYARVAGGIKPMLKDAAEFLGGVYKSEDQRIVEKVERVLSKGLGIAVGRLPSDPFEKTRVCLDVTSKTVKTPKFRLTADAAEPAGSEPLPEALAEPDTEPSGEPNEISVDPSLLTGIEDGTVTKSDIATANDRDEEEDDEEEDEEDEKDPDDMDDEEYAEYRERQAERETDEFFEGRAETMRELEEQGAYDD